MRNLFILLKVNLDEEMGISSFHHQRSARGKISGLLKRAIMLLLGVVIIGLFYTLGHSMASTGFADAIPVFAYIIGSILTLIITILRINETLAGKADTEFVMSLPINNFIQVFCLFLRLYLWNTLFVLLTNVPMILCYAKAVHPSESFWLYWLIGIIMTSLPVTGVAALLGMFLALILAPLKNGNQIHSIITLVFLSGIILLVLNIGNHLGAELIHSSSSESLIAMICKNYKLGRFYQHGVVEQQNLWLILFLLISTIWHLFFLFFLTITYQEITLALRAPKQYKTYKLSLLEESPIEKALFEREFQQWLRSRSYLVSTVLGVLTGLFVSLWLALKGTNQLIAMLHMENYLPRLQWSVPLFLATLVGASCTTYCSLSMEGKRHWIMETMPMDERLIYRSKIKLNLILTIPFSLICASLLVIAFQPGALLGILYFLIPACYAFLSAWWGLWVDRHFADYSIGSENQALRQSTSFFVGWLPGVALPLLIGFAILIL